MTDAELSHALLEWRDSGAPAEDVVQAIRLYVIGLKSCLAPSHIACERCSPGFLECMAEIDQQRFLDQLE